MWRDEGRACGWGDDEWVGAIYVERRYGGGGDDNGGQLLGGLKVQEVGQEQRE
jgi:hypothetical protein